MSFFVDRSRHINIFFGREENEAVKIAAGNLKKDFVRVFAESDDDEDDSFVSLCEDAGQADIVICTCKGESYNDLENKTIKELAEYLPSQKGKVRKEAYLQKVVGDKLYILGADRRGTIYGIYKLSDMLGVSPWRFFGDVPAKRRNSFELAGDYERADYPSVEYRGIFINDEEELEKWVKLHMGEETIGVVTYEKIFELLLRLGANYIWPAMHVNSFNLVRENGALADRMGIVVGTSHCDMLMRSNYREWEPWLKKKGYTDVEYDFSIPGRNREILREYWRESVLQNKDFEVGYTLGMRGIHDSGFQTKSLQGLEGKELINAKIKLLESVIAAQEEILSEELSEEPLKNFVPYKEVLELYDNGLNVPEDLTLIWTNDNYGYIRRYPGEKEKKRRGGNGIYYHNSYWAPSGDHHLFICSIPLAHTHNELKKAWDEGIRKVWVMNVGAIKPLELEVTYYLSYAWDIGKENILSDDVDAYVEEWINKTFSGAHGREMADVLNTLSQLTNTRKIEILASDVFSQNAYGDEATLRINKFRELYDRAQKVYESLPGNERDAFFQLCLLRIHAAFYTNAMFYYGDRSNLCIKQGKDRAAFTYTKYCRMYDDLRRKMLVYYGDVMSEGKWSGIVTPEDFPPPRAAMYGAAVPPLSVSEDKLVVTTWNDEESIDFFSPCEKWIELGAAGKSGIEFEISAPDFVNLSEYAGTVDTEKRILISPKDNKKKSRDKSGVIVVKSVHTGDEIKLSVNICYKYWNKANVEDGGVINIEASDYKKRKGFKEIPRLGRSFGNLMEVSRENDKLTYEFYSVSAGEFLLEIHRFPSLNSMGRLRLGISVDDCETEVAESFANDEWRSSWRTNMQNNVDKVYVRLPHLESGKHILTVFGMDKYVSFSKLVIYTGERKSNSILERHFTDNSLPMPLSFGEQTIYGDIALKPRDMIYAPLAKDTPCDIMQNVDLYVHQEKYGRKITPKEIMSEADVPFSEIDGSVKIDAASALAQNENAFTTNYKWDYCSSESYGRTGLAMHIREENLLFSEDALPGLNYRVNLSGGDYVLWMYVKSDDRVRTGVSFAVDGKMLSEGDVFEGKTYGRYSQEKIYRWVPILQRSFPSGEHLISLYTHCSAVRFDRIYITKKGDLPPVDADWKY